MTKNRQTRENFLMHWGLLEGAKAKIHKYIAREDTGKKTQKGSTKYRYFYTQSAWDKFKKGVSNASASIVNAGKSFVDAWLVGAGFNTKFGTMTPANPSPEELAKNLEDAKKRAEQREQRIKDSYGNYSVGSQNPDMWRGAAEGYADMQRGTREVTYTTKSGHAVTENSSGHGKWIAKAKLANGKTRYFYDKKQYERWKEVQTYQDNEPEFMKNYKEIDPHEESGRMPGQKEDYTLTNDLYTPTVKGETDKAYKRSTNCIYCSMTYEMRRRGYDVQAVTKESVDGESFYNKVYKATDDQPITVADSNSQVKSHTVSTGWGDVEIQYREKPNTSHTVSYPALTEKEAKKVVENYITDSDMGKGVRKVSTAKNTISDAFPEGSRGSVSIYWSEGGGHSFVWENTSDGVQFYDAQSNVQYSDSQIQELLDLSDPRENLSFTRTDNLEIRKEATNYMLPRQTPDTVYNVATRELVNTTGDEWYETKRTNAQ